MFRELYISIDELRSVVMPGYNIASDRWLFQHLTHTLDQRMLQLLMKNDDSAIASAFSVNLNVATLLSDRFLAFDANLKAATRGTSSSSCRRSTSSPISAPISSRAIRQGARLPRLPRRRHRSDPALIDRERLGLDLVKIVWNPDMLGSGREARRDEFRKLIASFGRAARSCAVRQQGRRDGGPVARHQPVPGPPYRPPARLAHRASAASRSCAPPLRGKRGAEAGGQDRGGCGRFFCR